MLLPVCVKLKIRMWYILIEKYKNVQVFFLKSTDFIYLSKSLKVLKSLKTIHSNNEQNNIKLIEKVYKIYEKDKIICSDIKTTKKEI